MSPLTLIALLGFGALLPIFENSNTDDSDETADPPDTDPAPVVDGSSEDDLLSAVLSETLNGAEGDDTLIAEDTSDGAVLNGGCLLYTSPSPRDLSTSRMPSSA